MKTLKATISQYDNDTDEKIGEFTGAFNVIFKKIVNFKSYYYRFSIFEETSREIKSTEYFGVNINEVESFEVNLATLMNTRLNLYIQEYEVENNKLQMNRLLTNLAYWYFDYKYNVFHRIHLNANAFLKNVDLFLKNNPQYNKVSYVNELKGKSGIYILVLKKYRGVYIGQSKDMKRRILQHWRRKDYFSGTGIDLYKAKDTTAIYEFTCDQSMVDANECLAINELLEYNINQMPGGKNPVFSDYYNLISKKKCNRVNWQDIGNLIEENPNIFIL